jgi:hypothetical protein
MKGLGSDRADRTERTFVVVRAADANAVPISPRRRIVHLDSKTPCSNRRRPQPLPRKDLLWETRFAFWLDRAIG